MFADPGSMDSSAVRKRGGFTSRQVSGVSCGLWVEIEPVPGRPSGDYRPWGYCIEISYLQGHDRDCQFVAIAARFGSIVCWGVVLPTTSEPGRAIPSMTGSRIFSMLQQGAVTVPIS